MGQVLQAATAATAGMYTGCRAAQFAGGKYALGAGLDHFAVGTQHPRLHLFAGQGTHDQPGAAFKEHDATAVIGQALDGQTLLLAYGNLWSPAAARRLEAQASLVLGHQLGASKMPVDR